MRESNAEHQASVTVNPSVAEPDRPGPASRETVAGPSNLRRALLLRLRHDGPSSPEDLAAGLGVSRTGVLQQLHALETAGLVRSEKRGQYVFYSLVRDNLVNTLNGYVQEVCPVSRPLKKESEQMAGKTGVSGRLTSAAKVRKG